MLELLQSAAGPFGQVLGGVAGLAGLAHVAHVFPPMTMFSRARRTAWLLAASAFSTVRRRLSQVSMSTFSLRMRMPPERAPDGAVEGVPVDVGVELVVAQGDAEGLDLLGLPEPAGPLHLQAGAEGVGQLVDQHLHQDVDVGAVGPKRGGGQFEIEGVVHGTHPWNPNPPIPGKGRRLGVFRLVTGGQPGRVDADGIAMIGVG